MSFGALAGGHIMYILTTGRKRELLQRNGKMAIRTAKLTQQFTVEWFPLQEDCNSISGNVSD